MKSQESEPIIARDGIKLHLVCHEVEKPIAMIAIVHGFGEHIGRYNHVMEALAASNISSYGIDLRGHGKSGGKKGHAPSYDLLMDDIEELLKACRVANTELPLFLYGHSMGGNLVANFVLRRPVNEIQGFILSSAWIRLAFDPPAWQQKAAKVLSGVLPGFRMDNNLNASHLSKIPEVATAYMKDPLVNSKISAGLYQMIVEAGNYALTHMSDVAIKGLIYHGTEDQITSHDASKELSEKSPELTWVSYENVYHEGHNDKEQDQIINDLITWIESQISMDYTA